MVDDAADEVMACRLETDAAELGPDGTHTPAKPDYGTNQQQSTVVLTFFELLL